MGLKTITFVNIPNKNRSNSKTVQDHYPPAFPPKTYQISGHLAL
jgi:hypothetical protein